MLLSGACDGLERLTLRRVNALGISAVARYLACPAHSSCLRSLALYRREGHLAWADPVAEALAAGGAPHLEVRGPWMGGLCGGGVGNNPLIYTHIHIHTHNSN